MYRHSLIIISLFILFIFIPERNANSSVSVHNKAEHVSLLKRKKQQKFLKLTQRYRRNYNFRRNNNFRQRQRQIRQQQRNIQLQKRKQQRDIRERTRQVIRQRQRKIKALIQKRNFAIKQKLQSIKQSGIKNTLQNKAKALPYQDKRLLKLQKKLKDQKKKTNTADTQSKANTLAVLASQIRQTNSIQKNSGNVSAAKALEQRNSLRHLSNNNKNILTKLKVSSKETQKRLQRLRETSKNLKLKLKKQKPLKTANLNSCNGKICNKCSFHGDTNVLTRAGYKKIRSIKANQDFVWARNEFTGSTGWKRVLNQYSNQYDERLYIEIRDLLSGQTHTIISNKIHPFYVSKSSSLLKLVANSSGMAKGTNATGKWIEAQYLKPGYRLLNGDTSHSEIISVKLEKKSLKAYNLHVDDFHTFFVRGAANNNAKSIWVHNDCYKITSRIKESSILIKQAEVSGKSHQASLDDLTAKLKSGNLNPGIGSKPIGKGISEARSRDGARVYWRKKNNEIEILGKSDKSNQSKVVKEVLQRFGDE